MSEEDEKMLLQNLYGINSFLTDNVGYISGLIAILSFIVEIAAWPSRKKHKNDSESSNIIPYVNIIALILSVPFTVIYFLLSTYTQVPDVTNLTYTLACPKKISPLA